MATPPHSFSATSEIIFSSITPTMGPSKLRYVISPFKTDGSPPSRLKTTSSILQRLPEARSTPLLTPSLGNRIRMNQQKSLGAPAQ